MRDFKITGREAIETILMDDNLVQDVLMALDRHGYRIVPKPKADGPTVKEVAESLLKDFILADHYCTTFVARASRDLSAALHTLSEGRAWPDAVDSVSPEQAILCWRLVRMLISEPLPDKYRL